MEFVLLWGLGLIQKDFEGNLWPSSRPNPQIWYGVQQGSGSGVVGLYRQVWAISEQWNKIEPLAEEYRTISY